MYSVSGSECIPISVLRHAYTYCTDNSSSVLVLMEEQYSLRLVNQPLRAYVNMYIIAKCIKFVCFTRALSRPPLVGALSASTSHPWPSLHSGGVRVRDYCSARIRALRRDLGKGTNRVVIQNQAFLTSDQLPLHDL